MASSTMNEIPEAITCETLRGVLHETLTEASIKVPDEAAPILDYVAKLASNMCIVDTFHMFEWEKTVKAYILAFASDEEAVTSVTKAYMDKCEKRVVRNERELDIPEGEGEILCNVEFKLAYGGKILLNTTHFHVRRGRIYGLLGHNGCGKSTLMRAISSGALAGFPGAEELMKLRACFVDHDIDGSDANTPTIDFCLQEPILAPLGREKIREKLLQMEFTEELIEKPICNLSGGWKMKLALARAVLLNADLLLLDEPTNHLDVQKQDWLCKFLTGPDCEHVTVLVVSHDSKFLNKVLTDVIHYENMRLKRYTGNLDSFVEQCPMAKAYFSIHETQMKFTFPVPGPLEGVKSKTKAIIQAKNLTFTYPGAKKPTLVDVSVQCSQASRIACIGPNGAGKSTLIKCLVGETKPDEGCPEIYRHQNCRIAYVAQHAFHHIEQHLEMSPVEYIQWRFSGGLDKEQQAMEAAQMTDEEKAKLKQNFVIYLKELAAELDEAGNATGERRIEFEKMVPLKKGEKAPGKDVAMGGVRQIKQLVGRRTRHNEYEYEVKWAYQDGTSMEDSHNLYVPRIVLEGNGFFKMMKQIDDKIAAESGNVKPLTTSEIQKHLDNFGLHEEFGTYGKMKNLSGGQKVKCVIGASMWFCPHLVILDEPTNYLDRDSLGALSAAIKEFEGGVLMISHNAEFFSDIAPEVWEVPGDQKVHVSGAEWMEAIRKRELEEAKAKKKSIPKQDEEKFDSLGNKIETSAINQDVDRDALKRMTKKLKELKDRLKKGDASVEDEMYELESKVEEAEKIMKREKEAAKAEKDAQKKLSASSKSSAKSDTKPKKAKDSASSKDASAKKKSASKKKDAAAPTK
uniref:ABC transporter domain-containing protein n=1 Tax=Aureoumbra lagunensis TaxID=44058 RepID=A0A6S8B2L6_9STRA|mmetsp:Transcript_15344/g.20334  ORF Transcript_15344/g.20334 Transcript_15344/m.20334 type:complete len:854 (-) Transcript_15344:265-2826(-)|eukprot:CAMPEP_0197301454 /NCGR_PEP_ID=MMETSP0890-20130614/50404_1 /TAXON_ID=44058 ORGANISM="Aureoumbra lagunensis, Strain CCMP1510" /NCGR_SAMPLE_ID=MMETSP0890 /ASSEMBLY_ACC=CAM_ASM_000533 /LENGTH=853 /DNA_ID=CAMNT_0042780753 /DNA_START=96 /DNA_END=2657 /DNA_ORIENTATION=+